MFLFKGRKTCSIARVPKSGWGKLLTSQWCSKFSQPWLWGWLPPAMWYRVLCYNFSADSNKPDTATLHPKYWGCRYFRNVGTFVLDCVASHFKNCPLLRSKQTHNNLDWNYQNGRHTELWCEIKTLGIVCRHLKRRLQEGISTRPPK